TRGSKVRILSPRPHNKIQKSLRSMRRLFSFLSPGLDLLAQFATYDLARGGHGQLGHKEHFARVLMRRQAGFHVFLDLPLQRVGGLAVVLQHDDSRHDFGSFRVGSPHYGHHFYRGMLQYAVFYFTWPDAITSRCDYVVVA